MRYATASDDEALGAATVFQLVYFAYVMDIEGDFEDIRAIATAGALSVDIRTPRG